MVAAIVWFRRDLRLSDNLALLEARRSGRQVVPVVVLDEAQLASTLAGEKPLAFFLGGLRALDAQLRRRGSYLVVRRGDPADLLPALVRETGAEVVYAQADVTPFARARDATVGRVVPLRLVEGISAQPPEALLRGDGAPHGVFSQFARAWWRLPPPSAPLPAPERLTTPPGIRCDPLPDLPRLPAGLGCVPGEEEAQRRLAAFTDGEAAPIHRYAEERDRLDGRTSSVLSPYLRFGMLSPRQALAAGASTLARAESEAARAGITAWLRQLVWREFYLTLLFHRPDLLSQAQRPDLRGLAWENDPELFAAWQQGRTGYPVVDAAMRQLVAEGWLANRARLIAGSFLTKDLLVDWQWGERWFMRHLVDGDPALNNGNWQWVAGVGTDSQPYFRVFNPILQGRKFDPVGRYVRRWVPELARVPGQYIHEPWSMPLEAQRAAGCLIGYDYPSPVVDHFQARERTLALYRSRGNT